MKQLHRFACPVFVALLLVSSGCKKPSATDGEAAPTETSTHAEHADSNKPEGDAPAADTAPDAPGANDGSEQVEGDPSAAAAKDEAPKADAAASQIFNVVTAGSKIDFLMEAPLENIHGVARDSVHGVVKMSLNDLSTLNGQIKIDLDKLELFQAKRESPDGTFPKEEKNATQNEHMKTWFQISPDAPKDVREKNRWIVFDVQGVSKLSATDVTALPGAKRSVRALVSGDFLLHGRTQNQSALLQATFNYAGDKLDSVQIESLRPVNVSLVHHDIQPRSAFDKLAQKTLAALGQKVAEEAPVKFSFTLKP